jgi:D-3-phosphoglycerate dehydrogenase
MYKEVSLELDQIAADTKPVVNFTTVSNEAIFKNADFISLHVPAMDKPLIDEGAFQQMKPGVGILNCSRGGVVDESALIDNLNTGHVGFAGLDVFENEPHPNDKLLKHSRVSATPHIGASSVEGQARVAVEIAEKTVEHLKQLS